MGGEREAERDADAATDSGPRAPPGLVAGGSPTDSSAVPGPADARDGRTRPHDDRDLVSREAALERERKRLALNSLVLAVLFSVVAASVRLYFPGQTTLLWENSALATLFYGTTAYFRILAGMPTFD